MSWQFLNFWLQTSQEIKRAKQISFSLRLVFPWTTLFWNNMYVPVASCGSLFKSLFFPFAESAATFDFFTLQNVHWMLLLPPRSPAPFESVYKMMQFSAIVVHRMWYSFTYNKTRERDDQAGFFFSTKDAAAAAAWLMIWVRVHLLHHMHDPQWVCHFFSDL